MRPLIARIRRHQTREKSRGQSLVEFALTLPVILLLTLIALDFGRVYLGYINLQNMARIASNFAANNPDAWDATPNTDEQAQYRNQILADATATNCRLPQSGGSPVIPDPAYTDTNGDGNALGLGDSVSVALSCTFDIITPGISNILGGSVAVSASADFPVKTGLTAIATGGPGPVVGGAPNAAFSADEVISPNTLTVIGPTTEVEFRDTSGGAPDTWEWDFSDGTTSNLQDPLDHTFTCAFSTCSYVVTMKASNLVGSTTASMTVVVIGDSDVNFSATTQSGTAPLAVTFTEAATPGGDTYEWDFGDGNTATGKSASHTYNSVGKFDVTLTVTYPDPVGKKQAKKSGYIEVAVGNCTVPKLVGFKYNNAQTEWTKAGFSGTVSRAPGAPSGNFTITAQSLVFTSVVPCSSNVEVSAP